MTSHSQINDAYRARLEKVRLQNKTSLFSLAYNLLNYQDVNWRTHGNLIQALESPGRRKLINMPRGTLKSSMACVAYPIFRLLNNPNERILIDSELYTNSRTFLREIKAHLESPIFTDLYGSFISPVWNSDEIIIKQRTKPYKEASISVGGIGTTKVGQHYTIIIGDDYSSPANTNNPENAKKVVDHYRYNTAILEPDGTYVIIGTRYSELDIIGHILDNEVNQRDLESY